MTDAKKTGITLASLVAAVIIAGSAWPAIEPALTWSVKHLGAIFAREQVQALLVSSAIGVFFGSYLPHWMPDEWSPGTTRLMAGLISAGITFGAALILVPTRVGLVYALLAASATPTASQAIAGIVYWIRPCVKPISLKDET